MADLNNIEYIRSKLTDRELLEQLAEEASELAQASLKSIRACGMSNNVTPVSEEQATTNLNEEIDDVLVCLAVMGNNEVLAIDRSKRIAAKLQRWANRLGGNYDGK